MSLGLEIAYRVLALAGSLALFLFGMKYMSEALQKAAAGRLKQSLSGITKNSFKGIIAGLAATALIQSSSASTVMIVSFVNAGLINLTGALSLIMGANIGTTLTGWIVSVLGLKLSITELALPILGLAFPLLFLKRSRYRNWGEFLFGFALLFLGISFIQSSVPSIEKSAEIVALLQNLSDNGFLSLLLFMLTGVIVAAILQSSSASMALTLILCMNNVISYPMGAAMILGENIGTTVTANLAAIVANRDAKRAARLHLLFNIIGVIWMLPLLPFALRGVDSIMLWISGDSASRNFLQIPIALSIFHTSFNILNTALLAPFIPKLIKLSYKLLPPLKAEKRESNLRLIDSSILSTAELSLVQGRHEVSLMLKKVHGMLEMFPQFITEMKEEKREKQLKSFKKDLKILVHYHSDTLAFLIKLSGKSLSDKASQELMALSRISENTLRTAELLHETCLIIESKNQEKIWFTQNLRNDLLLIASILQMGSIKYLQHFGFGKNTGSTNEAIESAESLMIRIESMKANHYEAGGNTEYTHRAGSIYIDILDNLLKINLLYITTGKQLLHLHK